VLLPHHVGDLRERQAGHQGDGCQRRQHEHDQQAADRRRWPGVAAAAHRAAAFAVAAFESARSPAACPQAAFAGPRRRRRPDRRPRPASGLPAALSGPSVGTQAAASGSAASNAMGNWLGRKPGIPSVVGTAEAEGRSSKSIGHSRAKLAHAEHPIPHKWYSVRHVGADGPGRQAVIGVTSRHREVCIRGRSERNCQSRPDIQLP